MLTHETARKRRDPPHDAEQVSVENVCVAERTDLAVAHETLDDAAERLGLAPGFIKIDIDGGEFAALVGAERLLRHRRPQLIVETHTPQLEIGCGRLLENHGYTVRIVDQRKWLRDHRPIATTRWLIARPPN